MKDLMKPRYKVIADYPDSVRKVGTVIYPDQEAKPDWVQKYIDDFLKRYPQIFREMQWWEERRREEMAKYVKFDEDNVYRLDKIFFNGRCEVYSQVDNLSFHHNLRELLPATKEEFDAQRSTVDRSVTTDEKTM